VVHTNCTEHSGTPQSFAEGIKLREGSIDVQKAGLPRVLVFRGIGYGTCKLTGYMIPYQTPHLRDAGYDISAVSEKVQPSR
jgi:hypothetical protein